jgi:hypothetical protein
MSPARPKLKCPSGWFAAGREVRLAATLLSDGAFKLFVWVCLHAGRNSGRLRLVVADLARSLQKTEREITLYVQELVHAGIGRIDASGCLEIQELFWPYWRDQPAANPDEAETYVAAIRGLFLRHGCVSSSFSAADERLAADWLRHGVSLEHAERAIYLGVARKYATLVNSGQGAPITALSYFTHLLDEVAATHVSPDYWRYLIHRTEQINRRWPDLSGVARLQSAPKGETK